MQAYASSPATLAITAWCGARPAMVTYRDRRRASAQLDADVGPSAEAAQCAVWMPASCCGDSAVLRIDSLWLAARPMDMRAGAERLLASVVLVFGSAQAHHGYLVGPAEGVRPA